MREGYITYDWTLENPVLHLVSTFEELCEKIRKDRGKDHTPEIFTYTEKIKVTDLEGLQFLQEQKIIAVFNDEQLLVPSEPIPTLPRSMFQMFGFDSEKNRPM
ncbi:hypothetical protein HA402_005663 [Bradysia odoriphaga]|nr:hypothetical protein HA402_005663 [Bradysia odoriphaga]